VKFVGRVYTSGCRNRFLPIPGGGQITRDPEVAAGKLTENARRVDVASRDSPEVGSIISSRPPGIRHPRLGLSDYLCS